MLTVGASRTCAPFVRASSPSIAPTRSISPGFQVAPSADPHGMHTQETPVPARPSPRAPFGPSVTLSEGMPRRSIPGTCHCRCPRGGRIFSARVSSPSNSSTRASSLAPAVRSAMSVRSGRRGTNAKVAPLLYLVSLTSGGSGAGSRVGIDLDGPRERAPGHSAGRQRARGFTTRDDRVEGAVRLASRSANHEYAVALGERIAVAEPAAHVVAVERDVEVDVGPRHERGVDLEELRDRLASSPSIAERAYAAARPRLRRCRPTARSRSRARRLRPSAPRRPS